MQKKAEVSNEGSTGSTNSGHAHLPELDRNVVLEDYRIVHQSRIASIIARQEVFSGRAKFGIFGDGKEVAQVAMAHAIRKGDFRSGYYRDQTLMFALGILTLPQFFAQLYGHADLEAEPNFGGRQMTGHFATRLLNPDGSWKNQMESVNSSADISPTGAQMPRLVGLALASTLYRHLPGLDEQRGFFSNNGDEIAFGAIGNASCAEGVFWEAINAVGVLQAPMLLAIWDDGYGISVPNDLQIEKANISKVLLGFKHHQDGKLSGIDIYRIRGWDYPLLCDVFRKTAETVRQNHSPAIVHVTELTQPQGHSTSGSQERYKSAERLKWEREHDCARKMREWIIRESIAAPEELNEIETAEKKFVIAARDQAWELFQAPFESDRKRLLELLQESMPQLPAPSGLERIQNTLLDIKRPTLRSLMACAGEALIALKNSDDSRKKIAAWKKSKECSAAELYDSCMYSISKESALMIPAIPAAYSKQSQEKQGFEILNACFDAAFARFPNLVAMGEDIGKLGDVNQGFAGLQSKYGSLRIMDTGIREATIVGQAIGLALRGFKPIADIQYLDYILYALQTISDDLASLRWRTRGGQKAPVIIRTRGHRLEGIWHSGSPMAGLLNLMKGVYICVPRDAAQAAGYYNTLLKSDDCALIIETLNAYRIKAKSPDNIGTFCIPLGIPEILREGTDVTIVTYGACCAISLEASEQLDELGISAEIIDARTLIPFDINGAILNSLKKTNRILFLDEDFPGGATAFMMQQVIERQGGFQWLDAAPRTLSAKEHRPAYGSDGDYFSKPNREQIIEAAHEIMHESDPARFPDIFGA
jgi:pyruvate/2-oxoglutarate/acetoin dehydrogenase E1 component/TPP-dependent pyruvate/acetoin dehydrogenase alpha subunit